MLVPLSIIKGSLPDGGNCWPQTPNEFLSQLVASGFSVNWNVDFSLINYGSNVPDVDSQTRPWFRLFPDGTPDAWYVYFNGQWISPHPITPGTQMNYVNPATGLPVDPGSGFFDTLDGGSAGAVTATTGPFWAQVPADYNGRWAVNLARAGSDGDPNNLFFPIGKKGPITSPSEGANAVAAGGSGATIPGADGTYNLSFYNRYIVSNFIYRTSRIYKTV